MSDGPVYRRADTYTIDELKRNIHEMQARVAVRTGRLAYLEPLAKEYERLLGEQRSEGIGTNCLQAMRAILGVKLMHRELGEEE